MVLAVDVADFLGTTFGGAGAFFPDDFFLAGAKSVSDASSEIGRGGALLFVTKPDFLAEFSFLFFSAEFFFLFLSADRGSFLFGLLDGLR